MQLGISISGIKFGMILRPIASPVVNQRHDEKQNARGNRKSDPAKDDHGTSFWVSHGQTNLKVGRLSYGNKTHSVDIAAIWLAFSDIS